jgi:hypothetical protein
MKTGFYDPHAAGQAPPPLGQPVLTSDGSLLLPGVASPLPAVEVVKLTQSPALIVVAGGIPKVVLLKVGKRLLLGRDKKADIVLADVLVSRKQAEVVHGPGGFYIHDLGSSNGVFVNQVKIDNPYLLAHGDRISIGNSTIYFMAAQDGLSSIEGGAGSKKDALRENALQDRTCSSCGASNTSVARFCTVCGQPL